MDCTNKWRRDSWCQSTLLMLNLFQSPVWYKIPVPLWSRRSSSRICCNISCLHWCWGQSSCPRWRKPSANLRKGGTESLRWAIFSRTSQPSQTEQCQKMEACNWSWDGKMECDYLSLDINFFNSLKTSLNLLRLGLHPILVASTSLPANNNTPIWSMPIEVHRNFLIERLLLLFPRYSSY